MSMAELDIKFHQAGAIAQRLARVGQIIVEFRLGLSIGTRRDTAQIFLHGPLDD
jgi:hypothetical protein